MATAYSNREERRESSSPPHPMHQRRNRHLLQTQSAYFNNNNNKSHRYFNFCFLLCFSTHCIALAILHLVGDECQWSGQLHWLSSLLELFPCSMVSLLISFSYKSTPFCSFPPPNTTLEER